MRHFRKIGFKDGEVVLRWTVERRGGLEEEKSELTSKDPPLPSFHAALQALAGWVGTCLEIGEDGLTIRSVSINHEEDRRGFVVTALTALPATFNAPLVLNSPHLREGVESEEIGPGFADDTLIELVNALEKEASRYLGGERQQRDLFRSDAA